MKEKETMSKSVNKVILVGNIGRDAETKFTQGGTAVTKFSVATSRRWKDQQSGEWKEQTNWTNVVLWNAEKLASYLVKGKQVYVEGHLSSRSYDGKSGEKVWVTEVVSDDILLLGGGTERGGRPASHDADPPFRSGGQDGPAPDPTDDDVPF